MMLLSFAVRALGGAAILFLLLAAVPAAAQSPAEPLPRERIESLLVTLKDDAARARFLGQIEALLATETDIGPEERSGGLGAAVLATLSDRIDALTTQIGDAVAALATVPQAVSDLWTRTGTRGTWIDSAEVAAKVVAVLAAGLLAELLAGRLLRRPRTALERRGAARWWHRLTLGLARTLIELVPILAFAAAAYALLPAVKPSAVTRLIALAVVNANLLVRLVLLSVRLLVAPHAAGLRLVPLDDESANYVQVWARRLTVTAVYGYFLAEAALVLGLPPEAHAALLKLLALLLAGMLIVLILQTRTSVAAALSADVDTAPALRGLRNRLAEIWHILAILYVAAVFGVLALGVRGGFEFLLRATMLSALVLLVAVGLARLLRALLDRIFRLNRDTARRYPTLQERANRYLPLLHRIVRATIAVVALLAILDVWGVAVFAWLGTETGRRIAAGALSILFILTAALVAWEILSALIERFLRRQQAAQPAGRGARLATLLPLLRNAVRIVLVVMVALIVLGELGLDIGPLLAGAGVVGLAVGFGAQALVKDVITGGFVLVEDSLAVGDIVAIGDHKGTIEGMSIRTVRIRDLSGDLHIVPFGEISTIINRSRDFSYAMMDIGVAYREDYDEVVAVLKEVAEEMRADPVAGVNIVEPLNVMGLQEFGDSAVVVRIRFKTRPGTQFGVKRAFQERVKRAFDARGIEIPFPHQTVYFGEDKQGKAPPARIAIAGDGAPPAAEGNETVRSTL